MTAEQALWNILQGKCIPYKKESKGVLANVVKENAELKRLLKFAIEDMNILWEAGKDEGCLGIEFKWRYADEAMKLIKECILEDEI